MNPPPGKIGIVIPDFSKEIHWYKGMWDVRDCVDIVVHNNKFLDRERLSIYLNGRPAGFRETVKPGDILEVKGTPPDAANRSMLEKIFIRMRAQAQKEAEEANRYHIFEHEEDDKVGFNTPTDTGFEGLWGPDRYTCKEIREMSSLDALDYVRRPGLSKMMDGPASLRHKECHRRRLADRVGPKISELPKMQRRRDKRDSRFKKDRIKLRFHLTDFGENPIELYAKNYEPIQIHFNIIRKELVRMNCIDENDKLDFVWPHLRWTPCGNTRVRNILAGKNHKTYGCFVRLKDSKIGDTKRNCDYAEQGEDDEWQDNVKRCEYSENGRKNGENTTSYTHQAEKTSQGINRRPRPILRGTDRELDYGLQDDLIALSRPGTPHTAAEIRTVSEPSVISGLDDSNESTLRTTVEDSLYADSLSDSIW